MMDEITQDQREYIFFSKPDWIDIVCDNVANGGSIVNLAELIKIPHHKLLRSIRQSKEYSDKYSQALDDRKEWARETVLKTLADLCSFNFKDLFDSDGKILPIHQWPDVAAKSVAGMDVFEEYDGFGKEREQIGWIKKIKTTDRLKAIELVMKNLSMLTEKHEVSGELTMGALVYKSYTDGKI